MIYKTYSCEDNFDDKDLYTFGKKYPEYGIKKKSGLMNEENKGEHKQNLFIFIQY